MPGSGCCTRVTFESLGNDAAQVGPQSSPDGSLVTVPNPLPVLMTSTRGSNTTSQLSQSLRCAVTVMVLPSAFLPSQLKLTSCESEWLTTPRSTSRSSGSASL